MLHEYIYTTAVRGRADIDRGANLFSLRAIYLISLKLNSNHGLDVVHVPFVCDCENFDGNCYANYDAKQLPQCSYNT